jgi:hypothetical protein
MDEVELAKRLMLTVLVINLMIIIFAYFTNIGLSVANPNIDKLNNYTASITSLTNSTSQSFNFDTGATGLNAVYAFIVGLGSLIVNLSSIMGLSIIIIVYMVFVLIPSLFNSSLFGAFAVVFQLIYASVIVIIMVYGFNLIKKTIGEILGIVRALIPR